ncbi:MAG: glycerol-3-phosphate dehydrogenase [Pseudomonadota bacterium]
MAKAASDPFDIVIIGGGINGAGIARDAAGRGYSVLLAEMNDLASGTSSWSTKLIHGGLRYLEHFEFRLVREALVEREVLLRIAPHAVAPMRFILPHHDGIRRAFLIRLGLFLYDALYLKRSLPGSKAIRFNRDPAGQTLKPGFQKGFEYSDCAVDDTRLVILNARDAADRGADLRVRTKVISARRDNGLWRIDLQDEHGKRETVGARMIINAAGPWADRVASTVTGLNAEGSVRMVRGSHIVVRRHFEDSRAFIFQNEDDRVIFAIPYRDDFTLIGTTDCDYEGDPAKAEITPEETNYMLEAVNEYFARPVQQTDIVWQFSGVRPLYDDGEEAAAKTTRDYVLSDDVSDQCAVINIYGGKLTTYRKLAETVLERIGYQIGAKGKPWTSTAQLPGGDFNRSEFETLVDRARKTYGFLSDRAARRLTEAYGTRLFTILGDRNAAEVGADYSGAAQLGLYACELDHLIEREWACSVDDVLWRRSKLGLFVDQDAINKIDHYLKERRSCSKSH